MDSTLYDAIRDNYFSKIGEKNNNILLIKHYNTFMITEEGYQKTKADHPSVQVVLFTNSTSAVTKPYDPFLTYIMDYLTYTHQLERLDDILNECNIYNLQIGRAHV